jgi:hypothetical protein
MNARRISFGQLSIALTTSISLCLAVGCGTGTAGGQSSGEEESGSSGSGGTGASQSGAGTSGGQGSGSVGPGSGTTASGVSTTGTFGGSGTPTQSGATAGESGSGGSGVGTTGSAGTGATGSSSGTGVGSSGAFTGGAQAVTNAGGDLYHRATYTEPGLTATAAATMAPDATFNMNATFPGNGNSQNQGTPSVLYLENGPAAAGCPTGATGCTATARAAGAGVFFAFAALGSTPNAFAFDETTGLPVWTSHVAAGGDGIRGTPVVDGVKRMIYIATGPGPHSLHAISADTGVEVTTGGWPVTLGPFGGNNDGDENQHGALIELGGIVYVPFGGHYGDGGNYNGWVFAVNTATTPPTLGSWATQSARSGIWGAGGIASDGTSSVFAVTGDTNMEGRNGSDSQEVVRLTGMAAFTRSAANVFVPQESGGWDRPAGDLDFGASTPAYVPLPAGSTPAALLVAPAKAGRLFVLDGTNLSNGTYDPNARTGSANAQLADIVVSGTGGETVYTSPTIYTSASGLHATINVGGGGQNCPGGNIGGEVIVSTLIKPGTPLTTSAAWCAKVNAGGGHMNFPPISTTTDGKMGSPLVWFIDGSQLRAVEGDSGMPVLTTAGAGCMGVPSMSFPIAVKNRIVVWALGRLCSWSPGGT